MSFMRLRGSPTTMVLLGLFFGVIFGAVTPVLAIHGDIVSKLFIQCVKAAATPLVFFAVLDAILSHRIVGRDFAWLMSINLTNASIAIAIGIAIAHWARPGDMLQLLAASVTGVGDEIGKGIELKSLLMQQFPASIAQPFADNAILPTVIMALVFGYAVLRVANGSSSPDAQLLSSVQRFALAGRRVTEVVLGWIVKVIPLAVFAASARVVALHGLSPFKGLIIYAGWCLLAMVVHVLFVYQAWIVIVARRSLAAFWRMAMQPVSYAFGVNSSLVALPLTLQVLDKLGVKRSASTLAACVGTNLNNDGIILYEGFTLLVIAQAMGIDLSLQQQFLAGAFCIVAAMGVAGIPEAGVVALSLVLSAFGISAEMIATLLSVDWLIARARSAVNVLADMTSSVVIDRWMEKAHE